MSDLIDRQAVLALAKDIIIGDGCKHRCIDATEVKILPTIDPVKHGKWEYVKKRLARGGYVDASECSVCHKIIMPHLKPNYCPNCGAKMDAQIGEDKSHPFAESVMMGMDGEEE